MLAVGIELLSGRYAATAYNDRDKAEWPPHPARFFSTLVATWAEGEPTSKEGEAEFKALRWLELQPAPDVVASSMAEIGLRDVVPVFVPVNDIAVVAAPDRGKLTEAEAAVDGAADLKSREKALKDVEKLQKKFFDDTAKATAVPLKTSASDVVAAARLLPEGRMRQPRTFPSVTPAVPTVAFVWPTAEPTEEVRAALTRLLSRVVRLGHSTSFVHTRMFDAGVIASLEARTTTYTTDHEDGEIMLRWVAEGHLDRLAAAFDRHRETEPHVLPATFVRYRDGKAEVKAVVEESIFDANDWIVLARIAGPRLPSTATAGIARQFRRALMSCADQPVAELISGHHADKTPSERPHMAVVPLPFVASEHADGSLLGVALIIPRAADKDERAAMVRAMAALEKKNFSAADEGGVVVPLRLGDAGIWHLQRVVWGESKAGLNPRTWTRPSRSWATATPVALDRNPGNLHDPDPAKRRAAFEQATQSIVEAVRHIGLPAPVEVDVVRSCVLSGTAKPNAFPRYPSETARAQRVLVHVRLVFANPVRGPILLGAGRYQGLGLFRPVDDSEVAS